MASPLVRSPSDPFLCHVPTPYQAVFNVLGVPVRFESNRRWLLRLAEQAYSGLPRIRSDSRDTPDAVTLCVKLLANNDLIQDPPVITPQPFVYSDNRVVGAIFTPADAALCVPELASALVTVSPAMRPFAYNIRYEMIEFACYRIVSHYLGAVGLHAACVAKVNASLLILGESGAGKSTLTFACMMNGWDLIGEDSVFVLPDASSTIRGVPRFIHLMDDSLQFFSGMDSKEETITRRSGKAKHEIDVRGTLGRPARVSAPMGALIFLRGQPGRARPRLRPLPATRARRLIAASQPFAPNYPHWREALEMLVKYPAYSLTLGTHVQEAVELINSLDFVRQV